MPMIELQGLSKSFRGKPALHEFSLSVERGEIFGLLGHNGAGKSTSLGILLGQVYPDAGEAFIGGVSVQRERAQALARTGAIFEAPRFYDYMSGWKNLEIFSSYTATVPPRGDRGGGGDRGIDVAHSRSGAELQPGHAPAARACAGACFRRRN